MEPTAYAELFDPADGSALVTGSQNSSQHRISHTATLLPNGKVLVYGGYDGSGAHGLADLYHPDQGGWQFLINAAARSGHTATLLPTGKVLMAGGSDGGALSSCQLFDSNSYQFTNTGTFAFAAARWGQTATLLANGERVLIAGGGNDSAVLGTAQLYDVASGTWSLTGNLTTPRLRHTATLLPNGKILVTGGYTAHTGGTYLATAELYDPANGAWTATGSMSTPRSSHTATLLPNGRVLVAGGYIGTSTYLPGAELYDPASGSWTAINSLSVSRAYHTATLLPAGKVVLLGGANNDGEIGGAALYDPATGVWSAGGGAARHSHTATLLPRGQVLISNGYQTGAQEGPYLRTARLFDPGLEYVRLEWQPIITSLTNPLVPGYAMVLSGFRFPGSRPGLGR